MQKLHNKVLVLQVALVILLLSFGICKKAVCGAATESADLWQRIQLPFSQEYETPVIGADTSGTIYLWSRQGLFLSDNQGSSWNLIGLKQAFLKNSAPFTGSFPTYGLVGVGISSLTVNAKGDMFGAGLCGVFSSLNKGQEWHYNVLSEKPVTVNEQDFSKVYHSSPHGALASLTLPDESGEYNDAGYYYSKKSIKMPYAYMRDIVINTRGDIFTHDSRGIFVSRDNAKTWQKVFDGEAIGVARIKALTIGSTDQIFFLAADKSKSNKFSFIYRSIDNGNTWVIIATFESLDMTSIAVNARNEIFIGAKISVDCCSNGYGVLYSQDNGVNWNQRILGGDGSVDILLADVKNSLVAAVGKDGVLCSFDEGNNWLKCNKGLPAGLVHQLIIDYKGYMYAVIDKGLYRTNKSIMEDGFMNGLVQSRGSSDKLMLESDLLMADIEAKMRSMLPLWDFTVAIKTLPEMWQGPADCKYFYMRNSKEKYRDSFINSDYFAQHGVWVCPKEWSGACTGDCAHAGLKQVYPAQFLCENNFYKIYHLSLGKNSQSDFPERLKKAVCEGNR